MNRRYFLTSVGALSLSQIIAGCSNKNQETLKIRVLKNSVPPQLLNEFRKTVSTPINLDFTPVAQFQELFKELQTWQQKKDHPIPEKSWFSFLPWVSNKSNTIPDLIMLGDYWLGKAIEQKLIQPLDTQQLTRWQQLPQRWKNIVTRNEKGEFDANGKIWAAPYRWGCTVIAYRPDKFAKLGWTPTDWSDLWREELRDRISLLDSPREVIGLTLKKLGYSYNTQQLDKIPNLKSELQKLHSSVKFYSSTNYLQPLILEDTWVAVGWSSDILPIIENLPNDITAVVPKSGTSMWVDLWVKPTNITDTNSTPSVDFAQQWIDFCWQPQLAAQFSLLSKAAFPMLTGINREELPKNLRENYLLFPKADIFQSSEFLLPISANAIQQYQALWQEIRSIRY